MNCHVPNMLRRKKENQMKHNLKTHKKLYFFYQNGVGRKNGGGKKKEGCNI